MHEQSSKFMQFIILKFHYGELKLMLILLKIWIIGIIKKFQAESSVLNSTKLSWNFHLFYLQTNSILPFPFRLHQPTKHKTSISKESPHQRKSPWRDMRTSVRRMKFPKELLCGYTAMNNLTYTHDGWILEWRIFNW